MTKTGIIVTAPGIIIVASTIAKIQRFPGAAGNLANAYPASEQSTSASDTCATAITAELTNARISGVCVSTSRKFVQTGGTGQACGGMRKISACVESDQTTSQ